MELCRSAWEVTGEDAEFSRVELFFDEDEAYQELVYYDEDGNVLQEVVVSDGS